MLRVPGWQGLDVLLIARGRWLCLASAMSVHMIHETGEDRLMGTFAELEATHVELPPRINASRLSIKARDGVAVLTEYVRDGHEY